MLDVPRQWDARAVGRVVAVLSGTTGEDQVAVRSAGVFGCRMDQAPADGPGRGWLPEAAGTVLITGGTGGIGAQVARWLAGRGAGHLLLVSRRGPDAPGAAGLRGELEDAGVKVTIAACDVADRQALANLVAGLPVEYPLSSVFHTAGVLDNGPITELTSARIDALFAPKADAALHLHELTRELELSAFVLFSSGAGVWGSAGQAGYAAANAFLDALAEQRRAEGLAATAVAWGPWAAAGMLLQEADAQDALRRRGVTAMAPALAVSALQRALDLDDTAVTVADIDWARFGQTFTAVRPSPFIDALPAETTPPAAEPRTARRRTCGAPRLSDRRRTGPLLTELVGLHAAVVLGLRRPPPLSNPGVPSRRRALTR